MTDAKTTRAMLDVRDLGHVYGSGQSAHHAIKGLSFSVEPSEFVSIVGPSGAGKTTLLKCVSGLMRPTEGSVYLHGSEVTAVPDDLALVFQDYSRSLFPWMTVGKNVDFPLERHNLSKGERRSRMEESLEAVGLSKFAKRYPWQLSGGMQQRVAIARALAYRPDILLMDEPFASVDAQTRADLEDLVLRVRWQFNTTTLFVTHDIDESVYLSDRVLVMSSAPARVVRDLEIDLPYPRDQIETKSLDRFIALRAEIAGLIRRPPPLPVGAPGATEPEGLPPVESNATHERKDV
jgi:NitT/TauT family transport system ATP-binding protein